MRKAVGVLLITLLLGSIVAAAGSTAYATTVEAQNDPYEKFWEILNREAELVVRLNATGNTTLVKELIQNSRFGAENAANISALIWQAMEELKASGVKTYYTAEELREMAQNISQNGLPQETVEALKAQGWTDEQIQALEDYIAKNAGEINEDFNMTAFLEDFSMAFIDVAFKYNEYGAWGLKTGYWKNIEEAPSTAGSSLQINPVLKRSWIETYASYYNYSGDSTGIETFYSSVRGLNELITALILDRIKPKEYKYTKFMPPHPTPRPPRNITLNISPPINPRLISPEQEITRVEKRTPNGGIVFTIEKTKIVKVYDFLIKDIGRSGDADVKSTPEVRCPETWIITTHTVYYWPSALEAYELSSNIMALLEAKKGGNDNPEIDKIINQKMAELKQSLGVYMIYSTNKTKRVSCYDNLKPGQPRPLSGLDTKETMPVEKASPDLQEPLNLPEWLIKEALDMENTLGVLSINGISVVVDRNDAGEIKYHVEISMVAKYNSVSKIQVNVSDKTSRGTDTGTISYLGPDEEETWRSGKFSARVSGSSIRITGNVKITYRPVCSSPPTSFKDGQTLSRKCQDRTITRSYSETIDLGSSIDWSKVDVIVTASRHNIVEGESVTYTVKVKNGNSLPVDGVKYRVTVSLPQFDPKNYSGTVTIPANGEKTILTKTVAYPDSGTYLARATISWNGHTKSASDKVIVTTGTLVISDVDVSPRNPDDGDRVRFDVSIRNPSSRSRSLNVKLFIDGVKESSRTVSIGGNGESTTTLVWTATAGNHDWRVEVWEDGKLEDSRSGSLSVSGTSGNLFNVVLTAYPTELEGGGEVYLQVKAWNYDGSLIPVKGFIEVDGEVIRSIEAKIPVNANGDSILTLTYNIAGVSTHTFKLFLDNYDGEPNGAGEEHWSEVKVEVKSWKADLKLECDDEVVLGENDVDDLDCTLYLFRTNPEESVQVRISEIDVGGAKVWPSEFKGVTLSKDTLRVTPNDPDDETHITITVDESFAEFYFGIDPLFPWHSYVNKLATEQPWEILVHFENALSISTTFQILKNDGTTIKDAVEYGGSGTFVVTEILERAGYITTEATGPGQLAVFGSRLFGYAGLLLLLADITENVYFYGWKQPRDFDNDNFVG
ncbi:hypothetical protein [Thermococcus indicus]|uniref:hypothetical protein n=1 Tax=Thermococcus indicus TaxID=2586643 RepID=UPI001F0D0E00|nr:hypothetical protein [Thermococcus indicus]